MSNFANTSAGRSDTPPPPVPRKNTGYVPRKPLAPVHTSTPTPAPQQVRRKPVGEGPKPRKSPPPINIPKNTQKNTSKPTTGSPRVLTPGGQVRTIYRDEAGLFNPNAILTESATRFTSPRTPDLYPVLARPEPEEPKRDRPNTAGSGRPGSRRENIASAFKSVRRRFSNGIRNKTEIMRMSPEERRDFLADKKDQPAKKPVQQPPPPPPPSRPTVQEDIRARMEAANARGKNLVPPTRMEVANKNLAPPAAPTNEMDRLSMGEYAALAVSKATDPFKTTRPRSNTADSDMSLGFDCAPVEAMHPCKRCKRPVTAFVHKSGLCDTCFRLDKKQRDKAAEDQCKWAL